MTVEKFVEFIVDLANDELYEKLDGNAELYFLNGGCYELAKVIKNYVPMCEIVINKDSTHCAIKYKDEIYDATGKIENKEDFITAKKEDIEYMEDRFGIPELRYINNVTISDFLIEELKKCNILHTLELDDNTKDDGEER